MDTLQRSRPDMVHETTKRDPERIYLEPWPYSPEGRLWSEENVWPLYTWPPEPEGESERATGVEYVRADLHDAEIARLTRELEEAWELWGRIIEVLVRSACHDLTARDALDAVIRALAKDTQGGARAALALHPMPPGEDAEGGVR